MNILLLASHAVAEYDDVRMFTDLGYDVFAPGGYEIPSRSGEGIRPALPDAPHHPELVEACNRRRAEVGEPGPLIDAAKGRLPDELIDWADAIIVHHFPERWIRGQWDRISHKRVIWRTCGQSNPDLEDYMGELRPHLQVVRYSPAERRYFEGIGRFAGIDALIRFGKYPDDYGPWTGDWTVYENDLGPVVGQTGQGQPFVGNVTQHMKQRGDSCGYGFWLAATEGTRWPGVPSDIPTGAQLPVAPAGDGSDEMRGGLGKLDYYGMLDYLAGLRTYLYTGTSPASYTLGLMEAMLSGVPIVSIGAKAWHGPDELFEADAILPQTEASRRWDGRDGRPAQDDPGQANRLLSAYLQSPELAAEASRVMRYRAIDLFDVAKVGAQWREFLGG